MLELIKNVEIASDSTKGYKFSCANTPNPCKDCAEQLVSFITQDIEVAYQHSRRNMVAIWISKD